MPGGDRTGPMGMGPMTGRAAGYCAGFPTPGFMNPIVRGGRGMAWGRGYGRGAGRGRGFGFPGGTFPFYNPSYGWGEPYIPPYSPVPGFSPTTGQEAGPGQELDMLKGQAEYLTGSLEDIKKRIEELESASSEQSKK